MKPNKVESFPSRKSKRASQMGRTSTTGRASKNGRMSNPASRPGRKSAGKRIEQDTVDFDVTLEGNLSNNLRTLFF